MSIELDRRRSDADIEGPAVGESDRKQDEDAGLPSDEVGDTPTATTMTPVRKRDFGFIPIPKSRRHNPSLAPDAQFDFTWKINLVFAGAATVSVMNLYYAQPMLVSIANDYGVPYDTVSNVPTLAQAGYGVGIFFISPLGDLARRRQLVLLLLSLTSVFSIGLALAPNVHVLEGLSFIVGMFTVTPQVCIPWTADLAPSNKRAAAMSITLSGLIFGLCIGRVLGGVLAYAALWRDTYWLAVGLQFAMLAVLWLALPDTPERNPGISYIEVLWSMVKYLVKYPTLVQACLMSFFMSATFAGFWTTLTFLLTDEPYQYNTLNIGLLGLLGLVGAILAPQVGQIVDRIVPWYGQLLGISINLISMLIALTAAQRNIGAICITILLYDCGQTMLQVSSSYRIAGLLPGARARLNGVYLLFIFAGQTSGTAILTKIYNSHGWKPTGGTAVAFVGAALVVLFMRGAHEAGWIGWRGGWRWRRQEKIADLSPDAVTERSR